MEEIQNPPSVANVEVGLLDVLVILAENFKLLIVGPLIVGVGALGIGFVLPQTYESVAVLRAERPVDPQNTPVGLNAMAVASLMVTASVLDPVAVTLGLGVENDIEEVRRKLREQIKPTVGRNDKLLTLAVAASSSQQAQALARAVLHQTYIQSRPKGSDLARLEMQLAAAKVRAENAQNAAAILARRLESPGAGVSNDLARSYADLLTVTAAAQTQIVRLETEIEGLGEAQLVQAPTLPQKASNPRKGLIAIGATLVAGLILLMVVFLRQALRNTAKSADVAEKLARIRWALGLR